MQIIINGLISGLVLSLLALSFQIVYLPTRVFFIGLAGLYTVAPYINLAMQRANIPWHVSCFTAFSIVVLLAVACEWLNHAPLAQKRASEGAHLISSLGIYIILVQVVVMIWGSNIQTLRTGIDTTINFGSVILTGSQILSACCAIALLLLFLAMLKVTNIGLRLRALADNPVQFALFGHNVNTHRLIAYSLAGLFATAASLLTAYDVGFDPHGGLHVFLLAVVSVIIGGRFSFIGPIIGGVILELIRAQIAWQFSVRWQEPVTFAVLSLFLLFRPQGLFGKKARIEATG